MSVSHTGCLQQSGLFPTCQFVSHPPATCLLLQQRQSPTKCLVSSSFFEWVIDSEATYHLTGNSSLFSTFQSQPSTSTVTLEDGSQSCVLGSSTIVPIPSLPLKPVLSLPDFSFNLMSISKLTRALKCFISFFS